MKPVQILFFVLLSFALAACSQPTASPTPSAPLPTLAATTEAAPLPSNTPLPTNTPAPSATPSLVPTITPTPTPLYTPTETPFPSLITDAQGVEMALIPAGTFQMGSLSGYDDESPVHTVTLSQAFYMDIYEVTNARFAAFLNNAGNQTEGGDTWLEVTDDDVRIHQSDGSFQADEGYANRPVAEITWFGAQAYCNWRGGRLPSESEWEYAARGGLEGMDYPWGNETPVCTPGAVNGAQFAECSGGTADVGSFAPNGYGLYDMAGNLWEWTADWYWLYPRDAVTDPTGSASGQHRVLRGGSWYANPFDLRLTARGRGSVDYGDSTRGFRCVSLP